MTASLRHLAVTQTGAVATVVLDRAPVNAVDLYEAMRCDGVPEERAFLMQTAVRLFGPKWPSSEARRRSRKALRRFDIDRLVATLDTALGERTRWRRDGPSAHHRRLRRAGGRRAQEE